MCKLCEFGINHSVKGVKQQINRSNQETISEKYESMVCCNCGK